MQVGKNVPVIKKLVYNAHTVKVVPLLTSLLFIVKQISRSNTFFYL